MLPDYYQSIVDMRDRDLGLLFQRLNFFLAGTAFLITAFATVVVSQPFIEGHSFRLVFLSHAIVAVGYYVAFLFLFSQYANVKIVQNLGTYLLTIEEGTNNVSPHEYLKTNIQSTNTASILFIQLFKDIFRTLIRPFKIGDPAPITWFVPIFFILFWIIIWFVVLPNYLVPIFLGLVIPIVWGITVFIIDLVVKHRNKKPQTSIKQR